MILDSETWAFMRVAEITAPMSMIRQTSLITLTDAPETAPVIRPEVEKWIRGRVEWVKAGVEKCPRWFRRRLQRFDPDLRLRWDFYKQHWVIEYLDRLSTPNLYRTCGFWNQELGEPLIETLRASDMRRKTPDEHIREAEERAEAQQKVNDHKVSEKYGEIFDNMSRQQASDFLEVSDALAHGESLTFAGPDADLMNKIHEEKEKQKKLGAVAPTGEAINPSAKLGRYRPSPKES